LQNYAGLKVGPSAFHFGLFFLAMHDEKLPQILIPGFLSSDFTFRTLFGGDVSMTQQWDPVRRVTWQGDGVG